MTTPRLFHPGFLLGILCGLLPALTAHAEVPALGRLFLTPDKRATLEKQRRFNIRDPRFLESQALSLDGVVRRSDGRSTVWINGHPQHDQQPGNGLVVRNTPDPAQVGIAVGDERSASMRVGQTIDRQTRQPRDQLRGGQVSIQRPPAAP